MQFDMERIREAHEAEIEEACVNPGILIQPRQLVSAYKCIQALETIANVTDGVNKAIQEGCTEQEARNKSAVVMYGARQRLEGAKDRLSKFNGEITQYL